MDKDGFRIVKKEVLPNLYNIQMTFEVGISVNIHDLENKDEKNINIESFKKLMVNITEKGIEKLKLAMSN